MKGYFLVLVFCVSGLFSEEGAAAPPYSLEMCQRLALERSQRLSIAELQVSVAREKINEIKALDTTTLSADASYNVRNNSPGSIRRAPHQSGSGSAQERDAQKKIKTVVGDKKVTKTQLSLIVPIYDFGYNANLVGAQKSVVEASECERARLEQDLLLRVAESYYAALESTKIEKVVLQSIKLLTQQQAITEDLFSVGLVTKNDTLGVAVQLAQREQEHIQAAHNIQNALASLHRLTELAMNSVEELQDNIGDIEWTKELQGCLKKVNDTHPELQKIQADIRSATSQSSAIRAENYPRIQGFVNALTSSDSYLLHKKWLQSGIGINIPLFDGGVVKSQLLQQKDNIKALELAYDAAYEDICLEVTKAFLAVDAAYHKIPVAKKGILHADENVKMDKDLYEEGLIAIDDLLTDEERLAQARSNYFQALYDFKTAERELAYALGETRYG